MHREKIREQLSVLEERLEQLEGFFTSAESNPTDYRKQFTKTQESFQDLQNFVRDETLRQRSITTEDFVRRILPFLIREAVGKGYEIHIGYYAVGRISMEMVEISINAILSCIRASLKCYQGMTRAYRMQKKLFLPFSFFLDVRADANEIQFKLVDDGFGYQGNFKAEFESEQQFKAMRALLAKHDGWFCSQSFESYGGAIQFRIPQQRSRFECLLLASDNCDFLLPTSCIIEILENVDLAKIKANQSNETFCIVEERSGLITAELSKWASKKIPVAVKVGVADFQFWILCQNIKHKTRARRFVGNEFISPEAWFHDFGVFLRHNMEELMPLVDGLVLMDFYQRTGAKYESL